MGRMAAITTWINRLRVFESFWEVEIGGICASRKRSCQPTWSEDRSISWMKRLCQSPVLTGAREDHINPFRGNRETKKESGIAGNAIKNRGELGIDSIGTSSLPTACDSVHYFNSHLPSSHRRGADKSACPSYSIGVIPSFRENIFSQYRWSK
jgi:hypothetical protein